MASRLQTKVMQINRVAIETLAGWSISISILIGLKSNSQLNLPQPSVQVHSQCADVTMASGWLALTVVCTQAYSFFRPGPTHDPCRCLLTPNLARSQRNPLFVCALNRNATGGEQWCLWMQVELAVG